MIFNDYTLEELLNAKVNPLFCQNCQEFYNPTVRLCEHLQNVFELDASKYVLYNGEELEK